MKTGISFKGLMLIKWAIWEHADWMAGAGAESCPWRRREFRKWLSVYGHIEALRLRDLLMFDYPRANKSGLRLVGGQPK